jgi:hypothetical protein
MKEIVARAASATELVCDHVSVALTLLDSWPVNGHGVFVERWTVIEDLDQAIKELVAARNMLAKADWPGPADYEGE